MPPLEALVCVLAMLYTKYVDQDNVVMDRVEGAIVAVPNAIRPFLVGKLFRSWWARIVCKRLDLGKQPTLSSHRELLELFLSLPRELDRIGQP